MSATGNSVRVARDDEADAVIAVLQLAFATDPPTRYLFASPQAFAAGFRPFAESTGVPSLAVGCTWLADDGAAAAIWLPPGTKPDPARAGPAIQTNALPERLPVLSQVGQALAGYHPDQPHWYLSMLGVDPMRQGRGLGSALLEAGLARCDADRAEAYLESSNPKNTPLYERFGFEVLGVVQPDDFPPLMPMLRRARR